MNYLVEKTKITISDAGINPSDRPLFEGDVFNSANYKIYILKHAGDYLYVGKTKQKISTKFKQGFKSYLHDIAGNRKAGYGGYKWIKEFINKDKAIELFVFDLGDSCTDNHTEAIEAEIVYKIRKKYDKWPSCQNEIHFFNDFEYFKDAKNVAKHIFKQTKD
jgi:hypothetical protein